MKLRRIVTDKHSIDIKTLENEEAVTLTDLETEQKFTLEADSFFELMQLMHRLMPRHDAYMD